MEAAAAGKLKALYVVGANPLKTFGVAQPDRLAGLELLVVQDMFLTETAQRADVVLPAASTYEKDGTLTNTAGEVQLTHRAIDPQGPRSDFDLLRILSHQLGMLGLGSPIRLRTPEAAFDEIRQHVAGYDLSHAGSAGRRRGTGDAQAAKSVGIVLRRARGRGFFFTRLSVYERHPGPLLFQAHFDERGKRDAVEFISQHPVLVVSLVKIAVLLFVVMTALAYLTWFERKVVAHIQSRWGPYYVGAHGLLQPLADGLKFLFKEDVTPPASDKLRLHARAISRAFAGAHGHRADSLWPAERSRCSASRVFVVSNIDIGLLFLFAITSIGVYGVALAGWSSNSKYPLLGGLRSSAQMISYEVSLTLSVVGVLLLAGTLNFNEIIDGQSGYYLALHSRAGTCIPADRRLPLLFHRRHRGNEPHSVRSARSRNRTGRRISHRIFQLQVRHVLHGRIREHDHRLLPRDDSFLRRLALALSRIAGRGSSIFPAPGLLLLGMLLRVRHGREHARDRARFSSPW